MTRPCAISRQEEFFCPNALIKRSQGLNFQTKFDLVETLQTSVKMVLIVTRKAPNISRFSADQFLALNF